MAEKLESVRDHADKLINEMVQKGQIAPDPGAAAAAAGIPTFSKGTATLDPNTGKPIAPKTKLPEFTEGDGVAIPEGTASAEPLGGAAPAQGKTAQELLAEHQARIGAAPAEAAPGEPAPTESAPSATAGATAADEAAQAIVDAFAEYEDFEFDDPDLGVKIPIRVPKQFVDPVKRGYSRRSAYDRSTSYLKNAEPVVKALIEDGRMNRLLPLIQAAIENNAYGEYVAQGYERLRNGQPLIEQARQEAAVAAQAPVRDPIAELETEDPFFAERVRPLLSQVQTLQQRLDAEEAQRRTAQQRQAEQQRLNEQRALEMQAAHADLARAYPDQYRVDLGPNDPAWKRAVEFAKEAGYADAYGIRAGIVFGGQQAAAIEAERLAATASPTATALQAAEAKHMALARQQAAQASRTVGGGSVTQAPPPMPRPKPTTRGADGKLKPPGEYLREVQASLAAGT